MIGLLKIKLVLAALFAASTTAGLITAGPASADPTAVVGLRTADEARGWQSVGKLVLGERGFCTGVLIAPQLVLTAAHCLFDKDTGARLRDSTITFQAGWRNGRAEAYRGVRRSVAHPDYIYSGSDNLSRVGFDLALLELDHPIQLPQILPFATGPQPRRGSAVSVVSYAMDRSEIPSIERDCSVMATENSALVLTCDIDFGSSGAPVFVAGTETDEAADAVVAVISAKADYNGRKVALAVAVDGPLEVLKAELARMKPGRSAGSVRMISGGNAALNGAEGPLADAETGAAVSESGGARQGGAKFIRP